MRLLHLELRQFRNLAQLSFTPSPHTTVCVGQNGQGKTNLLEAVYFLATLKPLRAGRLSELVCFGAAEAKVTGRFSLGGAEREISVEVQEGQRQAFVDGKRARSLEDYFGGVSVVAFTPDDLEVIKGGPEGRRGLLDRAVFNRFPAFLAESRDYQRALKGRNRLLKLRADPSYLEAFDGALTQAAVKVYLRRRALMRELGPRSAGAFEAIGRTPAPVRFDYAPAHLELDFTSAEPEGLSQALSEKLAARRDRDLERGFTSVGPHADDLQVNLGDRPARSFASQGQQRALVLAWKIAEIENLNAAHGVLPLLLLDDVSSELDPERNAYLMSYLGRSGAQVFLTTTDASLVRRAASADARWYEMRGGVLSALATAE